MTAYATIADLRQMLPQIPAGTAQDALLQTMLDRATDDVDLALGFSFGAYPTTATAQDVNPVGGEYLEIPAHQQGTVTVATAVFARGTSFENTLPWVGYWSELDDGRLYSPLNWTAPWYRVTAKWGYGPAPVSIVQVTLEIAVNLWRGHDRGLFSDVVGVEGGGAVGYNRALTNQQKMIIQGIRTRYGDMGYA